jgi:hypothetical protein
MRRNWNKTEAKHKRKLTSSLEQSEQRFKIKTKLTKIYFNHGVNNYAKRPKKLFDWIN